MCKSGESSASAVTGSASTGQKMAEILRENQPRLPVIPMPAVKSPRVSFNVGRRNLRGQQDVVPLTRTFWCENMSTESLRVACQQFCAEKHRQPSVLCAAVVKLLHCCNVAILHAFLSENETDLRFQFLRKLRVFNTLVFWSFFIFSGSEHVLFTLQFGPCAELLSCSCRQKVPAVEIKKPTVRTGVCDS